MNNKKMNHNEIKIKQLEHDNDRNNRLLHMVEIKREVKIVRTDIEIIKSDIKIILQLIQEKNEKNEKKDEKIAPAPEKEENSSWWYS
tara:strand:- start:45 stop:305 length:261 start_codon:yes stop_codon:yes gene_type:complete